MIWFETAYYTLLGSLPALPRHFEDVDRLPISRIKLDERLQMLEPADAEIMEQMADFLVWERQPLERTDAHVLEHYEQFMESVGSPFARDMIDYAVKARSLVACLRNRRLGSETAVGPKQLAEHVRRNWKHPEFRLGHQYPWIADVNTQMMGDEPFETERVIANIIWKRCKHLADRYLFTFEAVILYLIRWDLAHRWMQRDEVLGQKKFEALAVEAMGEFADMFSQGSSSDSNDN